MPHTLFVPHRELVLVCFDACFVRQLVLLPKKHQEEDLPALTEKAHIPLISNVRNLLFD